MNESEHPDVRVTDKRFVSAPEVVDAEEFPSEDSPTVEGEVVDEVSAARAEAAQYLDDLLRLKAEFENFRKRMVREQIAMVERASATVVEKLLPVLDNFELALMAADRTKDYASMVRGVEIVYSDLMDVLRKEGLEKIDSLHESFDPSVHDAVMHAEGEGDDIVVLEEMRTGYRFGGRVLRPSMVKVGPAT